MSLPHDMDLHPLMDSLGSTIEFRIVRRGRTVRVDVPRETLSQRFGVGGTSHGLLLTYEAHRVEIDAAVIRSATDGGTGVVRLGVRDLLAQSDCDRLGQAHFARGTCGAQPAVER
jgi:hypothetical protein